MLEEIALVNWRVFEVRLPDLSTTRRFVGCDAKTQEPLVSLSVEHWEPLTRTGVAGEQRYVLSEPVPGISFGAIKAFQDWLNKEDVPEGSQIRDVSADYAFSGAEGEGEEAVIEIMGLRLVDPTGFIKENPEVLMPMIEAMVEQGQVETYLDENGDVKLRSTSNAKAGDMAGMVIRTTEDGRLESSEPIMGEELKAMLKQEARKLN